MTPPTIVAIASGKGGTGKTTIATSLALSLTAGLNPAPNGSGSVPPLFLDCDVEAPNAHLFLKPDLHQRQEVGFLIPRVDEVRCTYCGQCAQMCQYHAIAVLGKKTLVFPQLCHGCGSCSLVCPENAISETLDVIGVLERGPTPTGIEFARGVLHIGQPMAVPVIRQLKQWADPQPGQWVIVDASPGVACPVVAAIRGADFLLLVTEPTPFGLHDLKLAVKLAEELRIPTGVVLNRCEAGSLSGGYGAVVEAYCRDQGLPILLRIPFERRIAEGIAQGKTLVEIHPETIPAFQELVAHLPSLGACSASSASLHRANLLAQGSS
ncbi:MAG: ATP-binding protein [Anaerolineales bacterium]|nr:ATP-binding protein [Anaerolineales bacterium]